MDDMPKNPMSSLSVGAAAMHEMFLSLVAAGFTEWQACIIVAEFAKGTTRG